MLVGFTARDKDDVALVISLDASVKIESKAAVQNNAGMTVETPFLFDEPFGKLDKAQTLTVMDNGFIPHADTGMGPVESVENNLMTFEVFQRLPPRVYTSFASPY